MRQVQEAKHLREKLREHSVQLKWERESRVLREKKNQSTLAYAIQLLPEGQVLALHGRASGANGSFELGDVGLGRFLGPGSVEILWPNCTRTRTTWPNVSWYEGKPVRRPLVLHNIFSEGSTTCGGSSIANSEVTESDISEIALFLSQEGLEEDYVGEAPFSNDSFPYDEEAPGSSATESCDDGLFLSVASRFPTQLVALPEEHPLVADSVIASEIAVASRPRGIVSL
jgi:hypothetical protein